MTILGILLLSAMLLVIVYLEISFITELLDLKMYREASLMMLVTSLLIGFAVVRIFF